ncbi:DUF3426 domain-containing protein [Trinickia dinghuensis]|uniref:DUF3426 domain-containing protein n=1 Tax=Trinickia dinghuensis TaxID=2291023 RepID=UPI00269F06CC
MAEAQARAEAAARAEQEAREAAEAQARAEAENVETRTEPKHESAPQPHESDFIEPAAAPAWARSQESAWQDDDEPHFNGRLPAEAEDEPHLEPHLRASLQAQAEASAEPSFGAAEPNVHAASVPPLFAEPRESDEHERHFAVTREARAKSPGRAIGYILGGIVAIALVVVLIAQLAWWRREAVMVYWPDSQPLFARVCAKLGCQLSPPRDIDGLQVEASDLRQVDGPHRLELRVPLRNRYGVALAYPAIELTLFDDKNNVAIRRILWPQDYVPPGTAIAAGLPAHATQTMIVRLDSGNAIATNFRVQIFYP